MKIYEYNNTKSFFRYMLEREAARDFKEKGIEYPNSFIELRNEVFTLRNKLEELENLYYAEESRLNEEKMKATKDKVVERELTVNATGFYAPGEITRATENLLEIKPEGCNNLRLVYNYMILDDVIMLKYQDISIDVVVRDKESNEWVTKTNNYRTIGYIPNKSALYYKHKDGIIAELNGNFVIFDRNKKRLNISIEDKKKIFSSAIFQSEKDRAEVTKYLMKKGI